MARAPSIACSSAQPDRPGLAGAARRRARRVALLLGVLVLLNAADLALTLRAMRSEFFHEANPVARVFASSPPALATFKIALAGAGVLVLWRFRRIRLTEYGSWMLCGVYGLLLSLWALHGGCLL